jgi:hypothetical protein
MPVSIFKPAAGRHAPFFDLSKLGWPEVILCVEGIVLLATLFLVPWFSTSGYGRINGHSGSVTGWQTYPLLRYFLLWCAVGAFILPWIEARGHELSWPRGEMTMVHGVAGVGLLIFDGLGFRPGSPADQTRIQIGYVIGLLAMVALIIGGGWRAQLAAPTRRKPPGAI